jgi:putative tributyrin esterase
MVLLAGLLTGCFSKQTLSDSSPPKLPPTVRWQDITFHSSGLSREERYRVFSPANFPSGKRLPVVYLLHGNGDHYTGWPYDPQIAMLASEGYLLVMPEGRNSYYLNSAAHPEDRYEDFVTSDLIADAEARFPTFKDREHRAIIGFSMGGYGAIVLSLKHPHLYAFAGSMSAPLDAPERHFSLHRLGQSLALRSIFGSSGSITNRASDPFVIAHDVNPKQATYIFMTCGKEESLEDANNRFSKLLTQLEIPHIYETQHGQHNWGQWHHELPTLLASLHQHVPLPIH